MKVIIFGSTGMIGKAVLLECLDHRAIDEILVINRHSLGMEHAKLKEIIHSDFYNYDEIRESLSGYDACFFPLGVTALGLSEEAYRKITYDITLTAAKTLVELNPSMVFTYVSGAGTDSSERGPSMWARVKGKTENDLMKLPFKGAYMFRPGYIQPQRGIKSRTAWYNAMYVIFKPLYPILKAITPNRLTTTSEIGKAMIWCALNGNEKVVVNVRRINEMAADVSM